VKCIDLPGNAFFLNGKFERRQDDLELIEKAVKEAVEMAVGSIDSIVMEGINYLSNMAMNLNKV